MVGFLTHLPSLATPQREICRATFGTTRRLRGGSSAVSFLPFVPTTSFHKTTQKLVSPFTSNMIFTPVVLSFALASLKLVQAQTSNTTLGIEAIDAHFTQSGIVPSLLPTFDPIALLTLTYDAVGDVAPGTALTQDGA